MESHEGAEGHCSSENIKPTNVPDDERTQLNSRHQRWVVGRPDQLSVGFIIPCIDISIPEPVDFTSLLSESADDPNTRYRIVDDIKQF